MEELKEIIGDNNRVEDVQWLCSLSESELDMLISLKKLVIRRAEVIGHTELVKKFDLKLLRALGLVLMEILRGKVMESSQVQYLNNSAAFMDGCNLLKSDLVNALSSQELKACIGIDKQKRGVKRPRQDAAGNTKEPHMGQDYNLG